EGLVSLHAADKGATNRVPKLHEPVQSPRSQAIPLGTPGQGADSLRPGRAEGTRFMGLENMDLRSMLESFDHTNRPVLRTGGQTGSVRAPRHRPDRPTVGGQGENFPAAGDLPDLGRAVQAGRGELPSVWAPGQRANQAELRDDSAFIMSLEGQNLLAGGRVPDSNLAIVATRC